ncbi:hypothetical protein BDV98DRAFT_591120 [Pterulicium gracile]|uniref:Uncharacterized protein n=1 Tax=Pterulicium gracile TaxID=1884261 RepID=A0A5C3QUW7_9AGAR|nr:hypothetical protein BDV98DRAFT_591120 [Pterula gracilis]
MPSVLPTASPQHLPQLATYDGCSSSLDPRARFQVYAPERSASATPLLGALSPVLALAYLCALLWMYRFAKENPRTLNNCTGTKVQKYAPAVYALAVLSGLAGTALTIWLLAQYPYLREGPNVQTRVSIALLLFASLWTSLTSGAYSFIFLHPIWTTYPICSIGSQLLWILLSWIFWVAGAGSLGNGVPHLVPPAGNSSDTRCGGSEVEGALGVLVCGVERGVYGLAILQMYALTRLTLLRMSGLICTVSC